jgi:hypothetical protein
MVEVKNTIRIYKLSGRDVDGGKLIIESHRNNDFVTLTYGDGTGTITVLAKALRIAIQNATNNSKF